MGSVIILYFQLSEPTERVSVDSKSKGIAFLKLLTSKDILCFLFFLLDVMSPLSRLSRLLQERTCVIGRQHAEISTTLEVIRKMKTKYVYIFEQNPFLRWVVACLVIISGYFSLFYIQTYLNSTEFSGGLM